MPIIETWVNGALVNKTHLTTARGVASYLKGHGWQVLEVYDIGKLVLFSPGYGETSKMEGN